MRTIALLLLLALCTPAAAEWKAHSQVSFADTWGNTDTETFAGKLGISNTAGANWYSAEASGLYGETNGLVTSSRWTAGGRYGRTLTGPVFMAGTAGYLKDTRAGIDARATAGPGIGCEFIEPDRSIGVLLSVLYTWEDHTVPDETQAYGAGQVEGRYTRQLTETLRFKQNADVSVSFEDAKAYLATAETALEMKISEHLAMGVSYCVNYQNEPPGGAEHTDSTFLTSLVVDL